MRGQLRYHVEKPVLLYDGASAHTASRSQHKLSLHFKGLQMPPYSCEFNSIETIWAVAKANFAKLCLVNAQPMTRSRFEQLVLQSLTMISPTKVNNIYTHNRKHIAKMLQAD